MSTESHENSLWDVVRSPDNICFACGPGNPLGLQLRFERRNDMVLARFIPGVWHGGWAGVVHGGILAALLDEAMAYAVFFTGSKCVTARMEVRYRAAVACGDELCAEARIARDNRRLVDVEGRILRGDTVVAEANGRFMKLGPLDVEAIVAPRATETIGGS
jgi:uncharacterized protein (TIGR00369 family)